MQYSGIYAQRSLLPHSLCRSILNFTEFGLYYLWYLICRYFFYVLCKQLDPDRTPRSVASDLGLHGLPWSHFLDARY